MMIVQQLMHHLSIIRYLGFRHYSLEGHTIKYRKRVEHDKYPIVSRNAGLHLSSAD